MIPAAPTGMVTGPLGGKEGHDRPGSRQTANETQSEGWQDGSHMTQHARRTASSWAPRAQSQCPRTLHGPGSITTIPKVNTQLEPLDLHDFMGFSGSSK